MPSRLARRPSKRANHSCHAARSPAHQFSTEGTGARHSPSPLLEWARANSAEVLAVQYAGRVNRKGDAPATSIEDIVEPLHAVLTEHCGDVPTVFVAHSVGTWVAYELLRRMEAAGKPKMPEQAFFSSFPPPTIPTEERPWNVNEGLDEGEFKAECRRWNVNEVVFRAGVWEQYQPLLRADFSLFDQYKFEHEGEGKFAWDLTVYRGRGDGMITRAMCEGWKGQTSGRFKFVEMDGHHLFPLEKKHKAIWLESIAKQLDGVMEVIEMKEMYGM